MWGSKVVNRGIIRVRIFSRRVWYHLYHFLVLYGAIRIVVFWRLSSITRGVIDCDTVIGETRKVDHQNSIAPMSSLATFRLVNAPLAKVGDILMTALVLPSGTPNRAIRLRRWYGAFTQMRPMRIAQLGFRKCRWSQKVFDWKPKQPETGTIGTASTSSTRISTFYCLWSDGTEVVVSSIHSRWDVGLHEQTTLGM